jgi:hypothetical protein
MKIKKIKILNSPVYNPDVILDFTIQIQEHLVMMASIQKVFPKIILMEIDV